MHMIGTPYFKSRKAAIRYYKDYGFNAQDVERKLTEGEIYIGFPPYVQANETVFVIDGRYHIQVGY